ncbi:ATP-binding protein [Lyngbya aestuarii]|uniref:ATP-binding protein n=1 Tax=Lyngbya aestuarii TaxID=118322 RepID=UPI00403E0268
MKKETPRPHNLIGSLQLLSQVASLVVIFIGSVVVLGWILDISILKSVFPGAVTMKFNTALSLILGGSSLGLWHFARSSKLPRLKLLRTSLHCLSTILASLLLLMSWLTLSQYLAGWNLGIDEFFFPDLTSGEVAPGRMAPDTALAFILFGSTLLLLSQRVYHPAQFFSLTVFFLAFWGLLGHIYQIKLLYSFGFYTGMALHTSLGLLLLSVGSLFCCLERGSMSVITRLDAGGIVSRRLSLMVIGIPPLLGWLILFGYRNQKYSSELAITLFSISSVFVFANLILRNAEFLSVIDRQRQEARERYELVIHAANDGFWDWNLLTGEVYFSPRWKNMIGYSDGELAHELTTWEKVIFAEDRMAALKLLEDYNSGKVTRFSATQRFHHKNGSTIHILSRATHIKNAQGQVIRMVGADTDITELVETQEALRHSKEELEKRVEERTAHLVRSNQELEQFAYVASHDLQEPLRTVNSYAQLLAKKYQGNFDARGDKYINYIVEGAARMQQLINDLLEFSRVGTHGKNLEPIESEVVLSQALHNLKMAITQSSAIVTHEPLPTVMGDQTQLIQLFQNLISNAIKFHEEEPPLVQISAVLKQQEWVFEVRDHGIGIEPDYLERIFIIFQRLHSRREYPGTGIGLAICKKIVERHGGHIWVESKLGVGTSFYFTIPLS